MSSGRRTPSASESKAAYDDVPMPEARPRAAKSGGLWLPPVWLVVVIAIVAVVGFAVSPLGQRLAGFDLTALLAPAAGPEGESGPSVEDLDRRLKEAEGAIAAAGGAIAGAEGAIANMMAQAEGLAAQAAALDNSEQVGRIGQSVAALEQAAAVAAGLGPRLSELEDAAAAAAAIADRVSDLEATADGPAPARELAALQERVAALEQAPAAVAQPTVSAERLAEFGESVAALSQRVEIIERSRAAGAAPAADLLASLAQTRSRLDALEQAPRAAIDPAQLAELARRLDALEQAPRAAIDPDQLAELVRRLDALEADASAPAGEQMAELARRLDDLAEASAAVDEAAVSALALRVGALEAGLIDAAPAAQVRALDAKLGALQRTAADAGRSAALAVAVSRLREAAHLGASFAAPLDEVRALAGSLGDGELEVALAAIEGRAAAGVPNLEALRQRFADLAVPILRGAGLDDDAGWLAKTVNRLTSVVSVRRTGEVAGPSPEARIARAEARLDAGDLAAALDELAPLEAPPGGPLAGWLDDARARTALNRSLDDVSARALALLGAS